MPAAKPQRPAQRAQLQTGTLLDADPAKVSRHLSDVGTAVQLLDKQFGKFGQYKDGQVPAPSTVAGAFLRDDGTWGSATNIIDATQAPYNAKGDGNADDTAAINAALTAAGKTVRGVYGGMVFLPKGIYRVSSPLLIPEGCGLVGDNAPSTKILALPNFAGAALVKTLKTGGQEFFYLQGLSIDGNRAAGASQTDAVVQLSSCFINSYVRDCLISGGSGTGLHVTAVASAGPVFIENTWIIDHGGDCLLIDEDPTNTQSVQGICGINNALERPGNGFAALRLKSVNGHCSGWSFYNTHIEILNNGPGTAGIVVDNVAYVTIDGTQIQAIGAGPGSIVGVSITNSAQNLGIQLRNVTNINGINPIIQDAKSGQTLGVLNVPFYVTSDVGILQHGVQTLTYGATVNTDLTLGDYCELLVTNGSAFTIANPTSPRLGQEVTYAIFNFSGGAMGALTWGSEFSFRDLSFVAPANGKGRTITFRRRTSNSWIQVGAASGDM